MVKRSLKLRLALLIFCLVFCSGSPARAEKQLVVDQAGTYSSSEAHELAKQAAQIGSAHAMDIVIVTTNDAEGKSSTAYADDFFDYNGYGVGSSYSGILFLLDYDNGNMWISTTGEAIRYLTDERIERILDAAYDGGFDVKDAYAGTLAFLAATADFLAAGIPSGQYTEYVEENKLTAGEGAFSALAGAGSFLALFLSTRRRYKSKHQPAVFRFRNNSIADLGIISDQLTKSYVTSRVIPQSVSSGSSSSSSSGRSSVHRSSSGRTHGGGGRKL